MPKQKRWDLKRRCDLMEANLNRALHQCNQLYNVYYPDYPDYYPVIDVWCSAISTLTLSISSFKEEI